MGVSDEPQSERDMIVSAAIELVRQGLDMLGLTPRRVFVSFVTEEETEDGSNANSGGWANEDLDPKDVFAFFLNHTMSMGRAIGVNVVVVPIEKGIGHD